MEHNSVRYKNMRVNGFPCLNPMDVNADHFFKAAMLDKPKNTKDSKFGSNVTLINVMQLPGLNTLGISIARIDYAPLGENPPHTHPRATEIFTVLEGTLYVGFVTSNQNNMNKLFSKVLNKGDVFPAVAVAALSSQNPGAITIANAVFGSKPPISDDVLAKAFQVEKGTIDWLQAQNIMASSSFLLLATLLALASWQGMASDPSPLQDFCVADMHSPVRVNGFPCLNPMDVNADHFFKAAMLDTPKNTKDSKVGSNVTLINVMQLPGLNTLGISIARIDYAPLVGLIHFQFNPNPHQPAVAIAALSSQNPGVITIANAVFGSTPPISDDVLAKAFQVEKGTIDWLQAQFWENNHY
uniref:Cupin type-1 domain-containing protein n=1 Tax=Leersia perrieri TaxID=77586 RepID=A0A0D9X558_9ORYZ